MTAIPVYPSPTSASDAVRASPVLSLPAALAQAIWRGNELGHRAAGVCTSGWSALDAELPGGGWPLQSLIEVLSPQPAVLEWRLLGASLRKVVDDGAQVVVIGPPQHPHLPGLQQIGLNERQFVWIQADFPGERLWVTEQLIKSHAAGAIVSWLPQARPEQIRRLQVCAQACEALVFLCRPEVARHESSAAPLRIHATAGLDWELNVQILKRRGPPHEHRLVLPSIPGVLVEVLTPRLSHPSQMMSSREAANAVGSSVVSTLSRQHATVR